MATFLGEYAGFDENEPTSKTGGKGEVIRRLKEDKGFKTIVHVGDGATDLEACPPASAFIGKDNFEFYFIFVFFRKTKIRFSWEKCRLQDLSKLIDHTNIVD